LKQQDAPSSYSNQPWRESKEIQDIGKYSSIFWSKGPRLGQNTLPLIVVIARRNFEFNEKPARTDLMHEPLGKEALEGKF